MKTTCIALPLAWLFLFARLACSSPQDHAPWLDFVDKALSTGANTDLTTTGAGSSTSTSSLSSSVISSTSYSSAAPISSSSSSTTTSSTLATTSIGTTSSPTPTPTPINTPTPSPLPSSSASSTSTTIFTPTPTTAVISSSSIIVTNGSTYTTVIVTEIVSTPTPSSTPSSSGTSAPSTAVIAGSVAAFGAVLLGGAVYAFFWKTRRPSERQKNRLYYDGESSNAMHGDDMSQPGTPGFPRASIGSDSMLGGGPRPRSVPPSGYVGYNEMETASPLMDRRQSEGWYRRPGSPQVGRDSYINPAGSPQMGRENYAVSPAASPQIGRDSYIGGSPQMTRTASPGPPGSNKRWSMESSSVYAGEETSGPRRN